VICRRYYFPVGVYTPRMTSRPKTMGACFAGSLGQHRGVNVSQVQFGDKLQGLPPVAGVRRPSKIYRTKAGGHFPNRDRIHCVNQLGSIGNVKNSQFASNADGVMVKPYCNQIYDKRARGKRGVPQHRHYPGIGIQIAPGASCADAAGAQYPGRCAEMARCFVESLRKVGVPSGADLQLTDATSPPSYTFLGWGAGRYTWASYAYYASLRRDTDPRYAILELRKCSLTTNDPADYTCGPGGYFQLQIRFLVSSQGGSPVGTVVPLSGNVNCSSSAAGTCGEPTGSGGLGGGSPANSISVTGFLGDPAGADWTEWLRHWIEHQPALACSGVSP